MTARPFGHPLATRTILTGAPPFRRLLPHMRIAPAVAAALAAFSMSALAQDPLVKQALQRIEKVEQAEAKATAGDARTLQGLLGDLDWAQKRLNAVVKPDAAHGDANKRLASIRAKVEAKKNAPAPTPAPASGATPPAPAAGGDKPATGGAPPAAELPYDAAALQQLAKEIAAATRNFEIVPANLWTDPSRRKAMERDLQELTKRIGQFPFAVADVQKVRETLLGLQAKYDAVAGKVAGDEATAADVSKKVEELLRTKYQPANLPAEPEQPYEPDAMRAFLLAMQQLREVELPTDVAFAQQAMQNTAVDRQRAETLRHTVTMDWPRRIAERQQQVAARVQMGVADAERHADWLLATDVADKDQIQNRVLGRGAFDQQMSMLRREAAAVASAAVHDELADKSLPRPSVAERQAQAAKVHKAIAHLQALAVAMLDTVRMPAAASTDAELLRIAEATLKTPDYKVNAWQRLVINAPLVRRERHEGSLERGTVRSTVTVYHYVWEEFQVATAEKVGDETWIFYNTLKRYQSGDSTTPIGRWILSQRFESTRILPENVGK